MEPATQSVTARLERLAAEFAELEPRERLELLLEFAGQLPPLPARFQAERAAGEHRVHECQTPVFVWAEVEQGRVTLHAEVAPEAPTVKGFVAILRTLFEGAPVEEVLALAAQPVVRLGLAESLGMLRARGLMAVGRYAQRLVAEAAGQ